LTSRRHCSQGLVELAARTVAGFQPTHAKPREAVVVVSVDADKLAYQTARDAARDAMTRSMSDAIGQRFDDVASNLILHATV